ncbi:MAG: hypothetical protein CM15mP115_05420 [Alphaproteobacteria bacterium]|nr:MAG: hypothetical protein CM15mP115_05420 [Alphaproteobacteria bacterium]
MRGCHLGTPMVEPVGTAEGHPGLLVSEIEWPLEPNTWPKCAHAPPPSCGGRARKVPCGGPLPARGRRFHMPPAPSGAGPSARRRCSRMNRTVSDQPREGRPAAAMLDGWASAMPARRRCDTHRIHSAPEQAARLGRLAKQEAAVGGEALRPFRNIFTSPVSRHGGRGKGLCIIGSKGSQSSGKAGRRNPGPIRPDHRIFPIGSKTADKKGPAGITG